jgi:non-specific serine/threonine protein kinase
MGEVYRARDPRLQRAVAIKVLSTGGVPDPERLRRFELEARAAAALTHPNILTIHDVGNHDGLPYLVLELLEGSTLRERLSKDGPLTPQRAVELGLQLARGVAAAHSVKVVHRDLKPENLFVTHDGILKILDFGLAKLRPLTPVGPDDATVDASSPGRMVGTVSYMAPEQLRGEPVDERADLFAVGIVLYELLSGRRTFDRRSSVDTMAAILREDPAPIETGFLALDRLVQRCLEKDPCERFQTARELLDGLERALVEPVGRDAAETATKSPIPQRSIAVLPFTDMSPTRDQDYLCDGIAEELILALSHIDGLRIAARSSSFQFRGTGIDIRAVGERLGVATILEGSVRKAGDRLRINVQLIDVADGYQRWSQRFDRKLEDVFAIQDEIAESVAESLRGGLSSEERELLHRPEAAVESYEYYLRGRQLVAQFTKPSVESARQMFERATEVDPGYAPAWAGLAYSNAWLYEWWGGGQQSLDAAETTSRKALDLGPGLAEPHAARGFVLALGARYDEAAAAFEQAIAINPNHFDALYLYARSAFASGKIEKSAELFRRAAEARREDFQSPILLGQSLSVLGRADEEREALLEGIRRAERFLELNPNDSRALTLGANALGDLGEPDRALRWSDRALDLYPDEQSLLLNRACLLSKLGQKEEAITILEKIFSRGWGKRDWIENDPDYDPLRDDPRFQALLDKLT